MCLLFGHSSLELKIFQERGGQHSKCFGSYMYNIELPQNFASNLNEKHHQVALLVRKAESKHENENISTGESLPGVPGVSKNQKLSTEYDFNSF